MKTGDLAPDFELSDQDGNPVRLSTLLADGPVALFFYPYAGTVGCTAQACHFRNLAGEFAEVGARAVGISRDTVDKQKWFAEKHHFNFPVLSDVDGTVARAYGTKRAIGPTRRQTIVIAEDSRVLRVIASEVNMDKHGDEALETLRAHAAATASAEQH